MACARCRKRREAIKRNVTKWTEAIKNKGVWKGRRSKTAKPRMKEL